MRFSLAQRAAQVDGGQDAAPNQHAGAEDQRVDKEQRSQPGWIVGQKAGAAESGAAIFQPLLTSTLTGTCTAAVGLRTSSGRANNLEITKAHQTLVIGSADTEVADLLEIALNAPTAECHCVVVDTQGIAIYVAEIIYRGDCVKLHIDLLDQARRSRP